VIDVKALQYTIPTALTRAAKPFSIRAGLLIVVRLSVSDPRLSLFDVAHCRSMTSKHEVSGDLRSDGATCPRPRLARSTGRRQAARMSGSTRPRPRRPSHEIAFSARLRGTSFKSALPGRQIGSRTWSGAGRGVSDETKLELGSVDRRFAGFPGSD